MPDFPATDPLFLSTLSLRRATRKKWVCTDGNANFYPRSPCGERRLGIIAFIAWIAISIHALLAESDAGRSVVHRPQPDFYPRSPCGERPGGWEKLNYNRDISIHALLAESDLRTGLLSRWIVTFLSTLSLRRATAKTHKLAKHN